MNKVDFESKMEAADRRLAAQGTPIHQRQFPALCIIAPDFSGVIAGPPGWDTASGPYEGPRLFSAVGDWLQRRYGDRALLNPNRGRIPFLLRGELYFVRIPTVYGSPSIDAIALVDGMTDDMKASLSGEEVELIGRSCFDGFKLIYEVDDMTGKCLHHPTDGSQFDGFITRLIERAIEDRKTAASCLDRCSNLNDACFHAQQSAEKMLKAFLAVRGTKREQLRKLGHRLGDILKGCIGLSSAFSAIANDVALLANIGMNIRYEGSIEVEHAIAAYWASLRTVGLAATEISGEERRFL